MPVGMKESPEKVPHIDKSSAASPSFRLLLSFMAVREKKNEKTPGSVVWGSTSKKKTHVSFVLQMIFLSFRVAS